LRLGQHDQLIDDLTELTARYPYRQRMVGQLLLALHQVGRTADALRLYAGYRRRLADELGLEPSPELQRLHLRILRAEAGTVVSPQRHPSRPPENPARQGRPRQLPADVPNFVGRDRYLSQLGEALGSDGGSASGTPLVLVTGMAGVGKTVLVTRWAHSVASAYPDGQLYVDLRGYASAPQLSEMEALTALLSGLGLPTAQVPPRPQDAAALYRSMLAGRRMLIVLDDAPRADLIRALLPGSSSCAVVVTSRDRLVGLVARNGASRIELDPLELTEAVELAERILGRTSAAGDPAAVHSLVQLCGRLPLAVRIAATQAADRGWDVSAQVGLMTDRLMEMLQIEGDEEAGVPAAFGRSCQALPPAAAALFQLLSTAPSAPLSAAAAADLAGIALAEAERCLRHLVNANLVQEQAADQFQVSDLLRRYVASCLPAAGVTDPVPRWQASTRTVRLAGLRDAEIVLQ
jgi:hypothetical protein